MIRLPWIGPSRPLSPRERPKRPRDLRFQGLGCREKLNKIGHVAVVGGGFAGLMAARRLVQHGIKVTVYEARKEVGGRVLSNPSFSEGRITEEGAELIGSFHTTWLELAREFGLAMVSRMDADLYEKECLDVQLSLGRRLSMPEFHKLTKDMTERILVPLAEMAERVIEDPSRPWRQSALQQYDNMSVQEALPKYCRISERSTNKDELLWKMLDFKLVNDEVAPLDEMNFLGLLCKVRGGQEERCVADEDIRPSSSSLKDGYWQELEIFRCADGCQTLAKEIARKIQTDEYGPKPAKVCRNYAITRIKLSSDGVGLWYKDTWNNRFVNEKAPPKKISIPFSHVVLAIPPSVWSPPAMEITVDDKDADPAKGIGRMQMNDAVKYFSDVKKRFWITEKKAPYGGALRLGQVWEGTDNQTRVGKQGIVLSVFAGPVSDKRRAPTREDFQRELRLLYPNYADNLNKPPLLSDWPNVPFIKTGYWTPLRGEIFRVGEKLTKPYHDRLFFAGEHTDMAFFGYMEGALRSGERAAETLMLHACDLLEKPAPKPSGPPRVARATPTRELAAAGREVATFVREPAATADIGEAESPFLDRNLFEAEVEHEAEPRMAALLAESPFVHGFEERRRVPETPDELEGDESDTAEAWEDLGEDQLTSRPEDEEDEFLDDKEAPPLNTEREFESPGELEGEEFAEVLSDTSAKEPAGEFGETSERELEEEDPITVVLRLDKLKIDGLPEITLTPGSGVQYEGFFREPPSSHNGSVKLTGRVQIEEAGVRRDYDDKRDRSRWPLGKAWANVQVGGPVSSSGASEIAIKADGTFTTSTWIGYEPYRVRRLAVQVIVESNVGKRVGSRAIVELLDLAGFLSIVDPKEKARPSSQSHLEFLASVRKIYFGAPKDKFEPLFNFVLYRHRHVKPLFDVDSAEAIRLRLYKIIYVGGEWLEVGHVLCGIEGAPKQQPDKDQSIPKVLRPDLIVTWSGDLGSAIQERYVKDFWNAVDKGLPLDLNDYLVSEASRSDLIGDIDGINIGSAYDSSRSLAENLDAYYSKKSSRRYHDFIANSKNAQGKAELPLEPGKKPPKLSMQARQTIASHVRTYLVYFWITGQLYSGTDPAKRKLIDSMMEIDSPEIGAVVDYFVRFLEDGLALEYRRGVRP